MRSNHYYAAIDLGSNSFHMIVVRVVAGAIQVVTRIRRKVRLASGLDAQGELDEAAIKRACDCLALFADRVQDIAADNIQVVATAAFRKVAHPQQVLPRLEAVLGHRISIISGQQEAQTIYQGVVYTSAEQQRPLVIDIGGASTEVIAGEGAQANILHSLDMGCVVWQNHFFAENQISKTACESAISASQRLIAPFQHDYQRHGWQAVLGASGTFKALDEMLCQHPQQDQISHAWLEQLLQQAIQAGSIERLNFAGLNPERQPVFMGGLCILLGLCRSLNIETIQVANGALREGLIYQQLKHLLQGNCARQRTLNSLLETYHLDAEQIDRVRQVALSCWRQINSQTPSDTLRHGEQLLSAASYLHEIGLQLNYQRSHEHSAYVIDNTDMPGFSVQEKQDLKALLRDCRGYLSQPRLAQLTTPLIDLLRILRLAIIFAQRRRHDVIPAMHLACQQQQFTLTLPSDWQQQNPYVLSLLQDEQKIAQRVGWALHIVD